MVIKAGTALLTGGSQGLDLKVMGSLVTQTAELHERGIQLTLVSSGAVAAGRQLLDSIHGDQDIPGRQVLAAIGQGRLMGAYEQLFAQHGITVAQALVNRRDGTDRLSYLNIRNTLLTLLSHQVIPIINENDVVAVEELGEGQFFGDNDRLSALIANLVDADLLVLLGHTPGLYTADPYLKPEAQIITHVERIDHRIEAMAHGPSGSEGRGGMITKIEAARLATASGVAVVIADGKLPNILSRLAAGESVGTFFSPTSTKPESRKRWMLSNLSNKGAIRVDAGAAQALTNKQGSLLPPGVYEIEGLFQRGDIVPIVDEQDRQLACGIVNYSAQDLQLIKGTRSNRIVELLGYHFGDEVVHRDNLVVL
jgi:glutamate 5-kinase